MPHESPWLDQEKPIVVAKGAHDVYIRQDPHGRIYFDECASDEEHLTRVPTPPKDRTACRFYLDDLIPQSTIGKRVTFSLLMQIDT